MTIFISSRSHGNTHNSDGSDPTNQATESVRGTVELATSAESTPGLVVQANDTRLTNSRSPLAHATSHTAGQSDTIKLDDLGPTDDNTDLNATTSKHGLLPKGDGDVAHFLNGALQFVTLPSGQGEANTASSIGDGEGDVFKQKSGLNLEFRSIKAGNEIGVTQEADRIVIDYTGSGGGGGASGVSVLTRRTTPLDVKNTTSEVNLIDYNLVGNTIGPNDQLVIRLYGKYRNNNSENNDEAFTVRLRIGNVEVWKDHTADMNAYDDYRPVTAEIVISNRNIATSQFIGGNFMVGNPALADIGGYSQLEEDELKGNTPINVTSSRNLGIDQSIRVTIQHENSSNNIQFICDLIVLMKWSI